MNSQDDRKPHSLDYFLHRQLFPTDGHSASARWPADIHRHRLPAPTPFRDLPLDEIRPRIASPDNQIEGDRKKTVPQGDPKSGAAQYPLASILR